MEITGVVRLLRAQALLECRNHRSLNCAAVLTNVALVLITPFIFPFTAGIAVVLFPSTVARLTFL